MSNKERFTISDTWQDCSGNIVVTSVVIPQEDKQLTREALNAYNTDKANMKKQGYRRVVPKEEEQSNE